MTSKGSVHGVNFPHYKWKYSNLILIIRNTVQFAQKNTWILFNKKIICTSMFVLYSVCFLPLFTFFRFAINFNVLNRKVIAGPMPSPKYFLISVLANTVFYHLDCREISPWLSVSSTHIAILIRYKIVFGYTADDSTKCLQTHFSSHRGKFKFPSCVCMSQWPFSSSDMQLLLLCIITVQSTPTMQEIKTLMEKVSIILLDE